MRSGNSGRTEESCAVDNGYITDNIVSLVLILFDNTPLMSLLLLNN